MIKCCSHGTLLHFGLKISHLNICYYHLVLHLILFQLGSHPSLLYSTHALLLIVVSVYRDG